jgi:hypothetical protein
MTFIYKMTFGMILKIVELYITNVLLVLNFSCYSESQNLAILMGAVVMLVVMVSVLAPNKIHSL